MSARDPHSLRSTINAKASVFRYAERISSLSAKDIGHLLSLAGATLGTGTLTLLVRSPHDTRPIALGAFVHG
jgi:hypothetical protein